MIQISIKNGRDRFWQWDVNQHLVIRGVPDTFHVHFVQEGHAEPLPVLPVKQADGSFLAPVPNILLQTAEEVIVYVYYTGTDEQYTQTHKRFYVVLREKPAEYIYTETQLVTWEGMIQQCEGTLREATNILTIADACAQNAQNAAETAQEAANAAAGKVVEATEQAALAANSAQSAAATQRTVTAYAETAIEQMARLLDGVIDNAEEAEAEAAQASDAADLAEAAAEDRAGVIAMDAAGATVTLPDSAERPLRDLTVDIVATQSADGTINGWSGAQLFTRGKNLLDCSMRAKGWAGYGITCQYNEEDDTYTFNGTTTQAIDAYAQEHIIATGEGQAIDMSVRYVSGAITLQENMAAVFYIGSSNDAVNKVNFNTCDLRKEDKTSRKALDRRYAFRSWFHISGGVTFDNYKVRIQIELGDTATEYEPFKGATASVDFGREVYGGRYDWRTGELTVTHKKVEIRNAASLSVNTKANAGRNWVSVFSTNSGQGMGRADFGTIVSNVAPFRAWDNSQNGISDAETIDGIAVWGARSSFGYAIPKALLGLSDTATDDEVIAAAKAYLTELGAYEVVEVATPEVVQLEPSALPSTLYPSTTIFADTGDVTLTYAADTKSYIDRRILELIGAK